MPGVNQVTVEQYLRESQATRQMSTETHQKSMRQRLATERVALDYDPWQSTVYVSTRGQGHSIHPQPGAPA